MKNAACFLKEILINLLLPKNLVICILMGIDYARLSLKTQSMLRSVIANLPLDIRFHILECKAMFRSFDLWFKYFKKLGTTTIPNPDELDEGDNVFI